MIEQGTPEWYAERLGKVTASRVSDVIAKTKSGWAASRANYMAELVTERLTGVQALRYVSAEMQWGTENEPHARAAYQFEIQSKVDPAPFVPHPSIADTGASPDGYVGADGLIEIKCPNTATHIETLLSGSVAGKYVTQMQWQMACTRRAWFVRSAAAAVDATFHQASAARRGDDQFSRSGRRRLPAGASPDGPPAAFEV
jgi:putative phage-type endonuclease